MILWACSKDGGSRPGGYFVDAVFHDSAAYTGLPVMLAVLLYTIQIMQIFWRDGYCARSGSIIWHPDGAELPPPVFLNLRAGILAPLAYHAWRMAA